jgi:hypothetical protein
MAAPSLTPEYFKPPGAESPIPDDRCFAWHAVPAVYLGRQGWSVLVGESSEVENQREGRGHLEPEMSEPGHRLFYVALLATALVTIALIGFLIWAFANHHVVNGHAALPVGGHEMSPRMVTFSG